MWKRVVLVVCMTIFMAHAAFALDKSGTISADETWTGTIHITGDVSTSNGADITVLAGTEIIFDANYTVSVRTGSVITFEGTVANLITVDASAFGGVIDIRGGQGVMRFSRMEGLGINATYPQAPPPLLVFEDNVHVGGTFSTYKEAVILRRNFIAGGSSYTMIGGEPGSEITDNVFVGGTWVTKSLGGTVRGNVFVSEVIPPGGSTNDYTHEHIVGVLANAVIERNIFVGGSYAAIMSIGADNGDAALIRNNTIDKRGTGAGYMFHLTDPAPQGLVFRNNIFMRGRGIQDEEDTPNALAYTDYNLFVDVSERYSGVVISGKLPGDDGFGAHDLGATEGTVFINPNLGYPFPYSDQTMLSGQKTIDDALTFYRDAYSLQDASPAIDAGSPVDSGDPEVLDGLADMGAVEYLGDSNPGPEDGDGDGIPDASDNCPYTENPGQEDSGGVASGADPSGLIPDGIGDACQCGDVNDDGKVTGVDGTLIARWAVGLPPGLVAPEKCTVIGDACNGVDATIVVRTVVGLPPGILQNCTAALAPEEQPPVHAAQSVSFTDSDDTNAIGGPVVIQAALDEFDVDAYNLYWGDAGVCGKVGGLMRQETAAGSPSYTWNLPAGTIPPAGAEKLLVFTENLGGEMGACVSTAIQNLIAPGVPVNKAAGLAFTDTDPEITLGGPITITRAIDESDITEYVLYWGGAGGCKINADPGYPVAKTGADIIVDLALGTPQPAGVETILVYTKNDVGEMAGCDNVAAPIQNYIAPAVPVNKAAGLSFTDTDPAATLGGPITITRAVDESDIAEYVLYWGGSDECKLTADPGYPVAKTGADIVVDMGQGTPQPVGADYILVYTKNDVGEMAGCDNVSAPIVNYVDTPGDPKDVRVSWTLPTQREDGSPLPASSIDRIEIHLAPGSGGTSLTNITDTSTTSHDFLGMAPDTYSFTLRTVDTAGVRSDLSTPIVIDLR